MDPAIGRLILEDSCRTGAAGVGAYYDPISEYTRCRINNMAFAKLINQLGAAVAPTASHAARTTGFGGFKIALEAAYTTIDKDAHYWKQGTEGPIDPSLNQGSIQNTNPDDVLQVYNLKLAKGFPFGLELVANFGYLVNTGIISGGADVRIAVFEGFRESVPGFIPDIGVGGGVRTISGTPEFKLTVASLDAEISKPIHIAGTVILQPHIGYQLLWIFGDSGLVDLTPNTDPLSLCNFVGENTPASPDTQKTAYDGQPNCNGGSSADFNNNVVFSNVRLNRHRLNWGAQLRYQMVSLGIHVITDIVDPVKVNEYGSGQIGSPDAPYDVPDPTDPSGRATIPMNSKLEDDPRTEGNDATPSQWTIAVELGAVF